MTLKDSAETAWANLLGPSLSHREFSAVRRMMAQLSTEKDTFDEYADVFSVGAIQLRKLGPVTRAYSEAIPEIRVDSSAWWGAMQSYFYAAVSLTLLRSTDARSVARRSDLLKRAGVQSSPEAVFCDCPKPPHNWSPPLSASGPNDRVHVKLSAALSAEEGAQVHALALPLKRALLGLVESRFTYPGEVPMVKMEYGPCDSHDHLSAWLRDFPEVALCAVDENDLTVWALAYAHALSLVKRPESEAAFGRWMLAQSAVLVS